MNLNCLCISDCITYVNFLFAFANIKQKEKHTMYLIDMTSFKMS